MSRLATNRFWLTTFLALLIGIFLPCSSVAQSTARLAGTVKDPSGSSVGDASVTLTNEATGVTRAAKTDADGNYLFSLVEIGTYRMVVEHTGFKKNVQSGIKLEVNQNGRLDITLDLGQTSETVEVTAAVPQVDTSGAVLGKVEDTKRIQDLPLVDRDTLQLGLLQAGVFTPDPDDDSQNPFNVSGQRSESLTFLVDGADNTDFLNNNIAVSPNPDAVAEFKILTNNYDAEFGRSSGGIVNQVIKSGTNNIHGTAFEFLRNDVFNARDYFLPPDQPKASFKRNVFGGTVGAPIIKNKTFVFAAYQGARRREGLVSSQLTVLTPAERTGDFGDLCGVFDNGGICQNPDGTQLTNPADGTPYPFNKIPVNPIAANYIAKYVPLPNLGDNGYLFSANTPTDEDQGILRFDHNFTSRDAFSALYLVNDRRDAPPFSTSGGGNVPVGSAYSDTDRNHVLSLTWTHTFGRGWINEARVSANRTANLQSIPSDTTTPADLGFTNINADDPTGVSFPLLFTSGFTIGPSPQGPTKLHDMTYQYQDHVTIPRGRHEWKFGGEIRRVQNNFNYDYYTNGSYDFGLYGAGNSADGSMTGNSLADLVGGFPDNYFQSANAVYGIRSTSYNFYGQDTFKILPRLTIVLGARYEFNSPMRDVHNNVLGYFGPDAQSTVFPNAPPGILYPGDPGTPNNALVYPDRNNLAPRFGFAWDVFGNSKLVVRGGYGIFYDIVDGALNLQFGGQPPFGDILNLNYLPSNFSDATVDSIPNYLADPFNTFAPGTENPFPFRAGGHVGEFFSPAISFAYVTDPHFRTPYSQNYNFGFQFQLAKNTALEAVYVGSLGRKLISSIDLNAPDPATEELQFANAGFINPDCARPLGGCDDPTDPNGSLLNIGQLLTNKSSGISDSHQLQVTLDQRYSHGLSFRGAYTLAKTIDLTSGFRARSGTYTDPFDPSVDRGPADFDVHQRFVFSGTWDLPLGDRFKGQRVLHKVVEGWQVNVISTFQSGTPFTLFAQNDNSGQANLLDRPDLIAPIRYLNPRAPGNYWFDTSSFDLSSPADNPFGSVASFGNLGRNALRGPGFQTWDISINKTTKITEGTSLEFRAELFNAFNHVNFLNPDTGGQDSTFGEISTARPPRIVQFALKFYY